LKVGVLRGIAKKDIKNRRVCCASAIWFTTRKRWKGKTKGVGEANEKEGKERSNSHRGRPSTAVSGISGKVPRKARPSK